MNRYTYYNSELDAFTNYHLEAEPSRPIVHGPSDESNAVIAGVSGAVGTSIANLVVYPVDLIVKRLQVQRHLRKAALESSSITTTNTTTTTTTTEKDTLEKSAKRQVAAAHELYTDFADAATRIYKEEGGIGAFYSGCVHDTANSMGNAFLYYLAHDFMRERRLQAQAHRGNNSRTLGMVEEISIGVLAGAFSKFITSPVSNIVTRKQVAALQSTSENVDGKKTVPSVKRIVDDIYQKKGITGFWSGYKATLFLTLNPSITLFLYETLKAILPRRFRDQPTASQTFMIAAVAKAVASSIMYPFSLAKARGQVHPSSDPKKTNALQMIQDIYKADGVGGLYEGIQGEVIKGFFQNGITMLFKEFSHRNILSLYFFLQRLRNSSTDKSLPSAVYEKVTSETPSATLDRVTSASQQGLDSAKETLQSTKETVTEGLQNTATTVTNVSKNGYNAAKSTLDNTKQNISSAVDTAKEKLATTYDAAKTSVQSNTEVVKDSVNSSYDAAKSSAVSAKDSVSNAVSQGGETIQSGKDTVVRTVQSNVDTAKSNLSGAASKAGDAIQAGKERVNETTLDARRSLANAIDVKNQPPAEDISKKIGGIEWSDKE